MESFIPFFNRLRDELVDIDKVDQSILKDFYKDDAESLDQLNDLLRIFPIYQNLKKENNLIDYNDMILDTFHALKNDTRLLEKVQSKYEHLIIDEFQDNNYALNEISRLISKKNSLLLL